jgi:hypothetical protein
MEGDGWRWVVTGDRRTPCWDHSTQLGVRVRCGGTYSKSLGFLRSRLVETLKRWTAARLRFLTFLATSLTRTH